MLDKYIRFSVCYTVRMVVDDFKNILYLCFFIYMYGKRKLYYQQEPDLSGLLFWTKRKVQNVHKRKGDRTKVLGQKETKM